MHIAIDLRPWCGRYKTGVGEYARGLFTALFALDDKNQYTLLSNLKKNPLLDEAFDCSRLCKFDGKNYIFNKAHIEIMDPLIIHGDVVLTRSAGNL